LVLRHGSNAPMFAPVKNMMSTSLVLALLALASVHTYAQELSLEAEPFTLGGSISARTVAYTASGIGARRSPLSYVLTGSITPQLYGIALPLSFTLTEQDRSSSQPLNQFGLTARHEWIALHGGYRNPSYSQYTLAGHQLLGAGVDLTPGALRLSFAAGEFQRAVANDTLSSFPIQPAFRRTGWAAKLGVETSEYSIYSTFLSASDDSTTLSQALAASVTPAENVALSFGLGMSPTDGLRIEAEWAASAYTRDVRSKPMVIQDASLRSIAESILEPRLSTSLYQALRATVALRRPDWGVNASYSRIDPDFRSMGAYAMNTDQEVITVAPSLNLSQQNVRLGMQLSVVTDNLQNKKWFTTERLQPMLSVSWMPSTTFGVDVQMGDVITTQASGTREVTDSVALNNRNPMLTLSPRLSFIDPALVQMVSATFVSQWYIDNNPSTRQFSEYSVVTANTNYSATFVAEQLSLGVGGFVTHFSGQQGVNTSGGFSANASKALPKHQLTVGATTALGLGGSTTTITGGVNGTYAPWPRHSIQASLAITSATFTELTAVLGYAVTF